MLINEKKMYIVLMMTPLVFIHLLFYWFHPDNQLIKSDVGGGIKVFIYRLLRDKPYRNLFYKRIGRIHFLFSWIVPRSQFVHINQDMHLGKHCHLEHAMNVFLNAEYIGDNFTCLHNVTLGQKGEKLAVHFKKDNAYLGDKPTVGDNVTVSCGAVVIGGIKIGNNVTIGSNCVVTHDVPDNATVVGNPARIVKLNGKRVDIAL